MREEKSLGGVMKHTDTKRILLDVNRTQVSIIIEDKELSPALLRDCLADENVSDCIVITDETVASVYSEMLDGLRWIAVPCGETSKSMSWYEGILEKMLDFGITRKGLVVAFGGGVVGDLAGFVAATYMRGIRLIQVPTTLLAMVDSSVGGKVAINLKGGKNLVGTFYQPERVYVNSAFLRTLSKREWSNGMAEVIKYAVGFDVRLMSLLEGDVDQSMDDIIFRCVQIKTEIVMRDEMDQGERSLLNFGHTIGHAIESYYAYDTYLHGEAVAIGIAAKSKLAFLEGTISQFEHERILNLLEKFALPVRLALTEVGDEEAFLIDLLKGTIHDKKALTDQIRWIGIKRLGQLEIRVQPTEEAIRQFIGGLRE